MNKHKKNIGYVIGSGEEWEMRKAGVVTKLTKKEMFDEFSAFMNEFYKCKKCGKMKSSTDPWGNPFTFPDECKCGHWGIMSHNIWDSEKDNPYSGCGMGNMSMQFGQKEKRS